MGTEDQRGVHKGRGAVSSPAPRFRAAATVPVLEDLAPDDEALGPRHPQTVVLPDTARTVISRNQSPDIYFDRSLNPYRGCEHGCIYCYARPTHAYLDLSPGLDFETRLFAKHDAPALLRRELAKPGYTCAPLTLGANTDAYQPLERELRITRGVLEVTVEGRSGSTPYARWLQAWGLAPLWAAVALVLLPAAWARRRAKLAS